MRNNFRSFKVLEDILTCIKCFSKQNYIESWKKTLHILKCVCVCEGRTERQTACACLVIVNVKENEAGNPRMLVCTGCFAHILCS